MKTTRIIKKYPNRRLYDTLKNTYITQQDIRQLVIDGIDFKVIDARTKHDLTQATLLQIIAEQENATPIFTTTMLRDFIRLYHEKSQSLASQYLTQAMALFTQQKEFLTDQWQHYEQFLRQSTLKQNPTQKKKK